jgi:hypothetical protein
LLALEKKKLIKELDPNMILRLSHHIPLADNITAKCRIYQSYIITSILSRTLNGGFESLAVNESREVTTMFIKIKPITFKTDSCLSKAQSAMEIIQGALYKYEGILRQFIVDDKGSVILCYFGLPPFSHENNPLVALKAGMEIQQDFKKVFGNLFYIGIATGSTFCGLLGNKSRADYTVIGDSANMVDYTNI